MARLILNLITWGIVFLSLGTLAEITLELTGLAAKESRTGLISISKWNKTLNR